MQEFITEILSPVNLPATILMGTVLLIWIMVIFGAVGLEALDFDPSASVDVDVNAGLGGDVDIGEGLANTIFSFFYLGEIPLLVTGSIFTLFFWILTVVTNHYFNLDFSWWIMAGLFLPCIGISLILTKLILMPLAPLFKRENAENDRRVFLIGRDAVVNTMELTEKFGEIKIEQKGPPLVINARNDSGQKFKKGDVVRIVGYDPEKDTCIVELPKPEKT